ncbi:MAG TPA: PilZ domain-containing protein [Polyangiaceae bacterium]
MRGATSHTTDSAFDTDLELLGTPRERRLGTRAATSFSAFITLGDERMRVRAAQISTTGVVLDVRHIELGDIDHNFTIELAVPGLRRPIRCIARLVRRFGKLAAFEFLVIGRDERLTLAEHIDRVGRAWGW